MLGTILIYHLLAGPPRSGQEEQFAPGPQGLRGLITQDLKTFNILTARNVLKCILSQSKGVIEKIFCSLRSQGASFPGFAPGPPKPLGGPVYLNDFHNGLELSTANVYVDDTHVTLNLTTSMI